MKTQSGGSHASTVQHALGFGLPSAAFKSVDRDQQ